MSLLGLVPFAVSAALAAGSGWLARCLAPRVAVPLLTLLALATSLATGLVLCLIAFGAAAQLPALAALGRWSAEALRPGQPEPTWGFLAGAVASALLAAALGFAIRAGRELGQAARACRASRRLGGAGRLVIARDDRPLAYAVPAGPRAIVISTGMLRLLSADERRALIAHEDAHLRQNHAVYVVLAGLAAAANPLLRPLARQVRLAVELQADAAAADEVGDRRVVARTLARASLAAAATGTAAPGVLALAETDACARVRALTGPPPRRRPWAAALALTLALASGTAALTLTMAVHQRIEAAQLVYDRAPAAQTGPHA
jgi:Zn-dependent protease with chaperone function